MKTIVYFCLVIILLLTGCLSNPVQNNNEIEEEIEGEVYFFNNNQKIVDSYRVKIESALDKRKNIFLY